MNTDEPTIDPNTDSNPDPSQTDSDDVTEPTKLIRIEEEL